MSNYPIIISSPALQKFSWPRQAVVLCDQALLVMVKKLFRKFPIIVLPSGEMQKRLSTVEWIGNELVKLNCDRQTAIIAVGGGVIGDLAGLVANLFMRGVPLYHVPTTLLAMVDSSIGGKNGVDLSCGKNLLGTFYQPQAVVVDPVWLSSLPETEYRNGLGEVVKYGVLDRSLFIWLEKNIKNIQRRQISTVLTMIKMCVDIKRTIVEQDEREQNLRMLLNLGHTFAHAFELLSQYTLPHGQAVAIGLAYATAYTNMPERNRVLSLLTELGLPTSLAKPFTPTALLQAMQADKKHQGKNLTLILPEQIGTIHIERKVGLKQLERWLRTYQG